MIGNDTRTFVKSSWSGPNGGNCVEWASTPAGVYVRDSKDRDGAELFFTAAEWDDLVAKAGSGAPHESIHIGDEGVRLTGRGGALLFTPSEWAAFTAGARAGECRLALGSVG
jgi:hypothetical protein